LVAGASVSLVVGAVSMAVREGPTAELLTGFTVVPLALSGLAVLAFRLAQSYRVHRRANERQGALADLGHHALTRPLWELCDQVEDALRLSLPAERCEVTLDSSAVTVAASPGRLAAPVPG